MTFGYLIFHIPYTSKNRNCQWVEYLGKQREGKGILPGFEGSFQGNRTLISTTTVFIAPGCRIHSIRSRTSWRWRRSLGGKTAHLTGMASQRHYFRSV